jgi:hypothetical protein
MTPASLTAASDAERELARRLRAVGDHAVVDDGAWDDFLARAAGSRRPRHRVHRPQPRVLAAAAAVTVLLGAAVLVTHHHRDDDSVRTTDHTTSTVPRTSTTTTTTTATTAPPSEAGAVPPGAVVGGGTGGSGGGPVATGGGTPAGPHEAAPTGPSADPGAAPSATTPTVYAGPRAAADATTTTAMGQYHVEVIYSGGTMYFRSAELATQTGGPPDGFGARDAATWGPVSGARCLTSAGGAYSMTYTSPQDSYTNRHVYGLAGPNIANVIVVLGQGGVEYTRTAAEMGRDVGDGLRAWIDDTSPVMPVMRIDGIDAVGNVVVSTTVQPDGPLESDTDWSRTNC